MAEIQAQAVQAPISYPNGAIEINHPITGEIVGRVPQHTADHVAAAVERARVAQKGWAALPFSQRAKVIKRFHDLILDQRENLFDVIQSESGKSRRDAFVEMFAVACEARYYAYNGGRYIKSRRVKSAIPFRDRSTVVYHPVGIVGVISPWNFPFILTAGDTIPALLAGNGVVLKPAPQTPLTALWTRDRLIEAGLPADLMQVVTGPAIEIANALIDHVDYVMFTGSTEVGRKVAERCARRLIPCSTELGGKNALLIFPDANIKHAATVAIEGTFNNSGQVCINFERIYVHEAVFNEFKTELISQTSVCRQGNTGSFECDFGSLISQAQLDTVKDHVQDAVSKGAKVLTGGAGTP